MSQSIPATIVDACAQHDQFLEDQSTQKLTKRFEYENQVLVDKENEKIRKLRSEDIREKNERMVRESTVTRKKYQASITPLSRDQSLVVDKFLEKLVTRTLESQYQVDFILKQRCIHRGPIILNRWDVKRGTSYRLRLWRTLWEDTVKSKNYYENIDPDIEISWAQLHLHLSSHAEMRWLVRDREHPLFGVVFVMGVFTDRPNGPNRDNFQTGVDLIVIADDPPYTSAQAESIISIPLMKNDMNNGYKCYNYEY